MRDLARWLKATADETRLRILYLLSAHGELCVCDIHETLGISQSRASRHLRTLREAGLVDDRRAGMWMHYWVRGDLPADRASVLGELLEVISLHDEATSMDAALSSWLERKSEKEACA